MTFMPGDISRNPITIVPKNRETKPNLNNSRPFNPNVKFGKGDPVKILEPITASLADIEGRKRARKEVDQVTFNRTIEALVVDLYLAHTSNPNLFITVSMRNENITTPARYLNRARSQKMLISLVKNLANPELAYIEYHRGYLDRKSNKGRRTRIRATEKLINTINQNSQLSPYQILTRPPELIQLKDDEKNLIDYEDTEFTRSARRTCGIVNRLLGRHFIDLFISDNELEHLRQRLLNTDTIENTYQTRIIDFSRNQLYRVFNKSRFDLGGRFYGVWWQSIPSEFRDFIVIDGEPTIELDYSGMSLNTLYSRVHKQPPEGDPYRLKGYEKKEHRSTVKWAFNAFLNAEGRMPDARIKDLPKGRTLKDLLGDLSKLHAPIAKYFQTGIGRSLQFQDSQIAEQIMIKMNELQIPILPIHDSFIVKKRHKDTLKSVMKWEYEMSTNVLPTILGKEIKPVLRNRNSGKIHRNQDIKTENSIRNDYSQYYQRYAQWFSWILKDNFQLRFHVVENLNKELVDPTSEWMSQDIIEELKEPVNPISEWKSQDFIEELKSQHPNRPTWLID